MAMEQKRMKRKKVFFLFCVCNKLPFDLLVFVILVFAVVLEPTEVIVVPFGGHLVLELLCQLLLEAVLTCGPFNAKLQRDDLSFF